MRRSRDRLCFVLPLVGGLAAAACLAGGAAAAADIAPHRAIYVMTLARPSAVLASASGVAALELSRTCEGWRYRQRYQLATVPVGGEPTEMNFQLEGRESLDNKTYSFQSTSDYGDGQTILMIGRAELGSDGGVARYTEPFAAERALPPGTGFVVGSLKHALAMADAGATNLTAPWFIGASPDEPLAVSSLIVPGIAVADDNPLLSGKRWRFLSGFYTKPDEAAPTYEGAETLMANGILAEAIYSYDGYDLKMTLQRLESLPEPRC